MVDFVSLFKLTAKNENNYFSEPVWPVILSLLPFKMEKLGT